MPETRELTETEVRDAKIVLETKMAGLIEGGYLLSETGKNAVEGILGSHEIGYEGIVKAVMDSYGSTEVDELSFVGRFLEQLRAGELPAYRSLAEYLDEPATVDRIKAWTMHEGVQFASMFSLLAYQVLEDARNAGMVRMGRDDIHDQRHVYLE